MGAILAWDVITALSGLLMLVLVALFVTLAMEPPVNLLVRKGLKRGLATGIVMLVVALAGATALAAFGQMFVAQVIELGKRIPTLYDQAAKWISERFDIEVPTQNDALSQVVDSWGNDLANNALAAGMGLFSSLINVLGLALIIFYLSAMGPQFRASICSPLPPETQRLVLQLWAVAQDKTAGYISSRVILAVINAVATYIFLVIVDVPYAIPLALFAGVVSQFVPTVGTYIGGAGPVLFALLQSPAKGLAALVFIVAYQQIENLLLSPKLTSKTMEINPAVAFVSVIALGTLLGPMGAFLSVPLVATAQAVISTYVRRYDLVEDDLLVQDTPRKKDKPKDPAPTKDPAPKQTP
jgi:predicted PurR-regulated permease PerM